MKNKVLALLTAAILLVNLFPLAAFAAGDEEQNTVGNAVVNETSDAPAESGGGASAPENDEADETGEAAGDNAIVDGSNEVGTSGSDVPGGETGDGSEATGSDAADENTDAGAGGSEEDETEASGSEETGDDAANGNEDAGSETGDSEENEIGQARVQSIANEIMPVALPVSGTCGDNLIWELDAAGVLTVSCTGQAGPMENYGKEENQTPWHEYKDEIKQVEIKEGVESVGDYAFYGCNALMSVEIWYGLNTIGDNAFGSCPMLIGITIREFTVQIAETAFANDKSVLTISAYEGSTAEAYAQKHGFKFDGVPLPTGGEYGSGNVKWALSPEGVLTISGTGAMDDYSSIYIIPWYVQRLAIKQVIIENGVTSIGSGAFSGLENLTTITIPSSITQIEMFAFQSCGLSGEIVIPENVERIAVNAFLNCEQLNGIKIEGANTTIEPYALGYVATSAGMEKVKDFVIKGHVGSTAQTYAEENDFEFDPIDMRDNGECGQDLKWVLTNDGVLIISGTGPMEDYDGMGGVNGEMPWYDYRHDITAIKIEDGVTSIGTDAFWYFTSVTDVTIPESVTSIGSGAFTNCETLAKIQLPSNLTNIESMTFDNCHILNNIVIPKQVKSIGTSAFRQCYALTDVTIPEGVATIDAWAFQNCSGLKTITIPASVKTIGANAFSSCENLNDITILSRNVGFGEAAIPYSSNRVIRGYMESTAETYAQDNKITFIALDRTKGECGPNLEWSLSDDGVLTISGTGTMENYDYDSEPSNPAPWYEQRKEIKKIVIENGVTSIGKEAFSFCDQVTEVSVPESITTIGESAFSDCSSLKNIALPANITDIQYGAFYNCKNLANFVIPDSVQSIGRFAFGNCETLTSVTLGPNVTEVGMSAFRGDSKLKEYKVYDADAVLEAHALGYLYENEIFSILPGAVIYGFEPSSAQDYADENGIPFESLGTVKDGKYTYKVLPPEAITDAYHWRESGDNASIHSTGPLQEFTDLFVDGDWVSPENYTKTEGSTIITLTAAYLDTLARGEHEAKLMFTNGSATTTITILEKGEPLPNSGSQGDQSDRTHDQPGAPVNGNPAQPAPVSLTTIPQTGDESPLMAWSILFLASALGLAAIGVYKHSRQR